MKLPSIFPRVLPGVAVALLVPSAIAQAPRNLPEAWVLTGTTNEGAQVYLDQNSVRRHLNDITFALKTVSPNRGFSLRRISANCNTRRWRTTSLRFTDAAGNTLKATSLPSGNASSGGPMADVLRSACGY